MRELTTAQIAAIVGKSERQVQRWIKNGKLSVQHIRDSRYNVDESVLETFIEPSGLSDIQAQLESLDYRLNTLIEQGARIESLLQELLPGKAKTPGAAARPRRPASTVEPLPDGAILLREYAMAHNMSTDTVGYQARNGAIQTASRDKPGRLDEQERYVLPEQQKPILETWRHNARFKPCSDENCACKQF